MEKEMSRHLRYLKTEWLELGLAFRFLNEEDKVRHGSRGLKIVRDHHTALRRRMMHQVREEGFDPKEFLEKMISDNDRAVIMGKSDKVYMFK